MESDSIVEFRNNINIIAFRHASVEFFQNILKYYDDILLSYQNDSGLFLCQEEVVHDLNLILKEKSNLFITEFDKKKMSSMNLEERRSYLVWKNKILISNIIIDSLFEDNYYNVLKNILELLHFQKIKNVLNDDKVLFYQKIVDSNYVILFRTLSKRFEEVRHGARRSCYSLINEQKNNNFAGSNFLYIYNYGYTTLSKSEVLHVSECDSFSSEFFNPLNKTGTCFVNRIGSVDDIINVDTFINEIQLLNSIKDDNTGYLVKKPDLVVCYNLLNLRSLLESIRLKVPMVIIKEKKLGNIFYKAVSYYVYNKYDECTEMVRRLQNICKR